MNFDFSDDEKMVQEQVHRYLNDNCNFSVFRSVLEGNEPYAEKVWQGLAEMGVQGTAVPAEFGGVEAGYLTLCLAAKEMGAHLAPVPFSTSVYLFAEALTRYGSQEQKEKWLPMIASGQLKGTIAVSETVEEARPDNITATFGDGRLNGTKLVVPQGMVADVAVVIARKGDALTLVLAELDGVGRTSIEMVDPTMATATLSFDNTVAEELGGCAGDTKDGWSALADIYNRAAVLFAFEQIGGAEKALDMAVAYAKERFAFGRPIGSFQALKHMMADMYVALKLAESNCYYAAWALQNDADDLAVAAAAARVSATQAFQLCARDNIQVHGGMGFTWEFDCHLYYRRSNYLTLVLGGLATWEDKLIAALPADAA
ncbi:MAG: acyl-CoA/acyl-ACP dehydrogenase [Pseudomonadales bacterium]|nr:acyl-CoA/acyl-ACP dehydrogenase [Pseudomonadales bacterium]